MNLKLSFLIAFLFITNAARSEVEYIPVYIHCMQKHCSDACGATATPYHEHIAGIAGSLSLNAQELTRKVVDYMTYGGEKAKQAIIDILAKNPSAQNSPTFKDLIAKHIERQKEIDAHNKDFFVFMACSVAAVWTGVMIYKYFQNKNKTGAVTPA